ncbi:hypothetical protein [Marinomonas sp. 2405UD68-3]|uniref:hypothetical protein n=1 Tax=Marinomonas sp. 2405UD68-3 TaxID=3391835 RepID=UPI0039C94F35
MRKNKDVRAMMLLVLAALSTTGCSSIHEKSNPGPESELVRIVGVATPTRLSVKASDYKTYYIDMAYFFPSTVLCSDRPSSCSELKGKALGKLFWVQREYDRFGLMMFSIWPVGDGKAKQPLNIDLIIDGGYARMTDNYALPNGKSELIAVASDLGIARQNLHYKKANLKSWQKALLNRESK